MKVKKMPQNMEKVGNVRRYSKTHFSSRHSQN